MREISITSVDEGQRLDKYLAKFMPEAPKSFFYKMMRKKNIVLNGKKAAGMEKLAAGDVVKLFLADDTIDKFRGIAGAEKQYISKADTTSKKQRVKLDIIFEDEDESQKSDAAESANASNGSAGGKPVRNPEREKPKWEDTITNRMLHWSYTPEQKEELRKALAVGVPKATILTYFYPDVTVEKMSSYRKK